MSNHSKPEHTNQVRLAENDFVAVDMCHCGTLQLHLGDLSLRLLPDAVLHLTRTLAAALARRQSLLNEPGDGSLVTANWSGNETPGKA